MPTHWVATKHKFLVLDVDQAFGYVPKVALEPDQSDELQEAPSLLKLGQDERVLAPDIAPMLALLALQRKFLLTNFLFDFH